MKLIIKSILSVLLILAWGCEETTEPDTTPPQVSISSPVNEASVRDSVKIIATVADNDVISKVEFFVDGELLSAIRSKPFEISWDTKQASNGEHNLQCKAIDIAGNETLSAIVKVIVANYLFKATFKDNWLTPENGQAIIFISDMDGNVLAEKTWSGNDSFEMFINDGLSKIVSGDITKISVTTVIGNSQSSTISTDMNIPVGSSWTWKSYPTADYNTQYNVKLDFQNVPEHAGYTISTKWNSRSSNYGKLTLPLDYLFYESPQNFYLRLNTVNNGVKYLWLYDVAPGTRQDNLQNMQTASSKTVYLPGNSTDFTKYLYGFTVPGRRYEGNYRLDYGYDNENSASSINLYYPESSFSEYRTSIYYYDENNNDYFWYQSVYGDIPNTFRKINADFEFISTSIDNFEISASGDFIQNRSSWTNNNGSYWFIYNDNTITKYKLPKLPNSVMQKLYITRESFILRYADLIDHSELSSNSEIIDILFNSDNYFYDVVNDFRSRTKYYNNGGLLKQSNKNEDIYEQPYHRR
ncbi:MAG: hypothetical protein K9G57_09480 [Ignavibacteriales bacterium]|nr:hypothetical protein [Ignavibacteriales bacterium]